VALTVNRAFRFVVVKAKGFIEGMAEAMGLPIATVQVAFRVLRDGGLLTTGARGVNAPDMTPRDAARMLLWALVSDRPADACSAVEDFGNLEFEEYPNVTRPNHHFRFEGGQFDGSHTLEQALTELISIFVEGDERREKITSVIVDVSINGVTAEILLNDLEHEYALPMPSQWPDFQGSLDETTQAVEDFMEGYGPQLETRRRYARKINQFRSVNLIHVQEIANIFRNDGASPVSPP
jgi:hypothetical protein